MDIEQMFAGVRSKRCVTSCMIALAGWLFCGMAAGGESPLTDIHLTLVDDKAIGFATFQSHNQKVVSTRHGIYMTHIRSANEPYTAQHWRLLRSTDQGRTFEVLHEATDATNPPVIEADSSGNLYLGRPDFVDHNAYLYRFPAHGPWDTPSITTIPGAGAGKYCMAIDRRRGQLYYFAHNGVFAVVGLDGKLRSSARLLARGPDAVAAYPQLTLAGDGRLFAAWTTVKRLSPEKGDHVYWDIHCMRSDDGGRSWQTLSGKPLQPPVVADQHGPADRITRDDEFEVRSWLSSFRVAGGKLHAVYRALAEPNRQRYLRLDPLTGQREVDMERIFSMRSQQTLNASGLLATRARLCQPPLYFVSTINNGLRLACLASDDNGASWYEYALSPRRFDRALYALGGARELTEPGKIIGTFTHPIGDGGGRSPGHVYFFSIQAGLSRAAVAASRYRAGQLEITFDDVRGQPQQVRFRPPSGGRWSKWLPFQRRVTASLEVRPTQFQLLSQLGVESDVFEIVYATLPAQ